MLLMPICQLHSHCQWTQVVLRRRSIDIIIWQSPRSSPFQSRFAPRPRRTSLTASRLVSASTPSKFAVGRVVAEAAEPHSALEVVAVADGLYTLRYRTDDAWRGHEITRAADALVVFGASLPRRAKPVTTYRED